MRSSSVTFLLKRHQQRRQLNHRKPRCAPISVCDKSCMPVVSPNINTVIKPSTSGNRKRTHLISAKCRTRGICASRRACFGHEVLTVRDADALLYYRRIMSRGCRGRKLARCLLCTQAANTNRFWVVKCSKRPYKVEPRVRR